jgi:hypothetical protein
VLGAASVNPEKLESLNDLASEAEIVQINLAIQRFVCRRPDRRATAVDAAAELDRLALLRDRSDAARQATSRPTSGSIGHAYQEGGRFWFIDCATR